MTFYTRQGEIPHKRHTQFRDNDGKLRFEELFSSQGFFGAYSLLYHHGPAAETTATEPAGTCEVSEWLVDAQRGRQFKSDEIDSSGDIFTSRRPIFFNDDVTISVAAPDRGCDGFFRNGYADELIVVAKGDGRFQSPFGVIDYEEGDLIVVPRGTIYNVEPGQKRNRLMVLESATAIEPPHKYFVGRQLGEASPYCERDIRVPQLQPPQTQRGSYKVLTKTGRLLTRYILPNHPCDVIGWDGGLYPYAFNVRDYEPINRRIHTMPDEFTVFSTNGAIICALVPRMTEYHPNALPAPPNHSSVDCDEVVFNMGGDFTGWRERPELTLNPRGFCHGTTDPEPSIGMTEFQGMAIMVDTFRPLRISSVAQGCEVKAG